MLVDLAGPLPLRCLLRYYNAYEACKWANARHGDGTAVTTVVATPPVVSKERYRKREIHAAAQNRTSPPARWHPTIIKRSNTNKHGAQSMYK